MNQRFWITLPTALLTVVLGTTSFTYAQPVETIDSKQEALNQTEILDEIQLAGVQASEPETVENVSETFEKGRRKRRGYRYRRGRRSGSGMASFYGGSFHGRRSASGERYNQYGLTAAHRSLPFGTQVRVTNLRNRRSVIVRINDRGPFTGGRVIDLSTGAARVLGMTSSGVAPVRLQVIGR